MNNRVLTVASLLCLAASPAMAGGGSPDVAVDVVSEVGTYVYEVTTYDVTVSNVGNKNANNVDLTIQLPETHTSPTVHVMGDLGSVSGPCSQSGTQLTCSLGRIRKNDSVTVSFEITPPESAAPYIVSAEASTSGDSNSGNDVDSDILAPLNYDLVIGGGELITNRHCTGQGLSSFYECELYPSSISSHQIILEGDNTVTIVGQPDYEGTWEQLSDDHLSFVYTYSGQIVAEFEGYGVGGDCFEGITLFPGSPYLSPYQVCVQ